MSTNTPTLFLPGKICDQRLFEHSMRALESLISSIYVDLTSQNSIDEMIDDVLAAAPGQFNLVGFSMGGYVAQEIALRYPERIARLFLCSVHGRGYTPAERNQRLKVIESMESSQVQGISDQALQIYLHPNNQGEGPILQTLRDMTAKLGAEVFVRQEKATISRQDRLQALNKLKAPTYVVGGDSDKLVSQSDLKALAQAIPGAELRIVPESGHMVPLEQEARFNLLLERWLSV